MLQRIAVCNEVLIEFCRISNFFKTKGSIKLSSALLKSNDLLYLISNADDIFIYNKEIFPKRVFIESYNLLEKVLIVKFKDYNSIDSVKPYINSTLMLKEAYFLSYLESLKHPVIYLNYKVLDQNLKELGYIVDIVLNIQNRLVLNTDIELPFVDKFIISIDNINKIIKMNLPEGLY